MSVDSKDFVSKRRIYTLNGLPPEVVAVAFARCSRSPEAFDKIAKELNEDKSRQFHEKWIVGYGHSSVAEHAVLSLAIENVSILATKVIEDNRLCSFTEKSSRYQLFDRNRYYKPKNLMASSLGKVYQETADYILDTYNSLFPTMIDFWKKKYPQPEDVSDKLYQVQLKNKVLDVLRYMLPVSVLTNLGMTVNARNLEHVIVKMLSHPLEEMRGIGEEIKEAALKVTPTLVKYTKYNDYMGETYSAMEKVAEEKLGIVSGDEEQKAVLVEYDKDADNKLVAALLYRFSNLPYKKIKDKVEKMNNEEKAKIVDEALKKMGKFDRPIRELEHVYYTFDVLMDYGAFRDLQRHRICTQTNQECTTNHGYCTPVEIVEAGIKDKYDKCMNLALGAYKKISKEFPKEAQYMVPLAFRKRTLFNLNLRECHHLIKLRTSEFAHASYKSIAQQMYREIDKVHPLLAKYIQVND
ncbi:MAG: FAD-dependent thymidylate synthase [Candidatus Aenigmarchaeota archaeon]|nr:FAD-dependent thymidylate synthase [Candidatus Aenigmarchaeota archaeon]